MKSALFVDFDNVYSGLRKLDPSVAQHFAQKPQRWMNWLVDSLQLPDPAPAGARRRVLVRRCYLNPQVYQRFRPPFNLAGFEIIDCPALTSEGKTSTDIHMVLDIIDLLQHETRYDEFIVFSADADFTPFESITNLIRHELAQASQAVPCSRIASLITAQHTNVAADWNGMGSFRRFLDSLNIGPLKVDWNGSGGRIYDPRRHTLVSDRDNKAGGNGTSVFDWGTDRDLLPLATQIHDVTSVPLLSPADYRVLFKLIASDLVGQPFDLKETGKRVRDNIRALGHSVSRMDVNWVLRGLLLRGHEFGKGEDNALTLSRKTIDNVQALCLREQILIDQTTEAAIRRWLDCGL